MLSVFGNSFDESDLDGLRQVMATHLVGMGEVTIRFEKTFASLVGFPHGIATNSCTNSFWLICHALKLTIQDQVLMPNIHFFGVRGVLRLFGVEPTVVDVDPLTPNVNIEALKKAITPYTRMIILLEYGGYPCNSGEIKKYLETINRQDILLVLDAANSPFTQRNNIYTAIDYDIAVYSFDMNKILSIGDGGMILVKDSQLAEKLKSLSYYGISDLHKSGFQKAKEGGIWWEVDAKTPSLKLPMNNLAASLGLTQLAKMDANLQKRKILLDGYLARLSSFKDLIYPAQDSTIKNNLYLFWLHLEDEATRNRLAKFFLDKGVYTTVKYQLLNPEAPTANAKNFYATSLCLPFNQNITEADLDYIVSCLKLFFV